MSITDENKKYCYRYPHPSVTTDCVIFGFDGAKLNVLLVQRGIEPYKGRWAGRNRLDGRLYQAVSHLHGPRPRPS